MGGVVSIPVGHGVVPAHANGLALFFRWGGGCPSHPSTLSMVEQIDFHLAVAFAFLGLVPRPRSGLSALLVFCSAGGQAASYKVSHSWVSGEVGCLLGVLYGEGDMDD